MFNRLVSAPVSFHVRQDFHASQERFGFMSTGSGPLSTAAEEVFAYLAANFPDDLHWSKLLLTLLLATGIWILRDGRGSHGADGKMRRMGLLEFLAPREVFAHPSVRVDAMFLLVRLAYPFFVGGVLLSIGAATERSTMAVLRALFGAGPQLEPNMAWMLPYSLVALLCFEFISYWSHWLNHHVPALWAVHLIHHSAEVPTPLTRYRKHFLSMPVDASLAAFGLAIPSGLFGWLFPGGDLRTALIGMGFVMAVLGFNSIFQHSHVAFHYPGWLSRWIYSPMMHHVHHSSLPQHRNRNLGTFTSIWDRVFGTLHVPTKDEHIPWGLERELQARRRTFLQNVIAPFDDWRRMLERSRSRSRSRS